MTEIIGDSTPSVEVKGVVKWFNTTKGFGFIQFENEAPDAFLHITVLEKLGRTELPEGAVVLCEVVQGQKGTQVEQIIGVESVPEGSEDKPSGPVEGKVKFFNPDKGFGFIIPDDGSRDVFISARILNRANLPALEPEQRVRVTTKMGQKGPMAESLEVM